MTTLLTGVNDVLEKTKILRSTGALSSLSDSARQVFIDLAVQSWNEMIDEIYSQCQKERPRLWTSGTMTLSTGTRTYSLDQTNANVVELYWPLHDQTNGHYIYEHPKGYLGLIRSQRIPANYTGLPLYGALDPTASSTQVYLDRVPQAAQNGLNYTYYYQKDGGLSAAADEFPFNDGVYRALVPAVAEVWRRHQQKDFDEALYKISMGRAARLLNQAKSKDTWSPYRYVLNETDPFHAY